MRIHDELSAFSGILLGSVLGAIAILGCIYFIQHFFGLPTHWRP